jgi:FkbM family methyltransferase
MKRFALALGYRFAPRFTTRISFERYWRAGRLDPELYLLPLMANPGRTGIDVGANIGIYSFFMSRSCDEVHAFEPNPAMFCQLTARMPANVVCHNEALSDHAGEVYLRIPADAGRATIETGNVLSDFVEPVETRRVRMSRLDDLVFASPVGFIKIDVEGHELSVCQGAPAMLRRDRPNLLIEAEERHRPGAVAGLGRFLSELGYRGFFLAGGSLAPLESFEAARDQAAHGEGSAASYYIHNFLFLAEERAHELLPKLAEAASRPSAGMNDGYYRVSER